MAIGGIVFADDVPIGKSQLRICDPPMAILSDTMELLPGYDSVREVIADYSALNWSLGGRSDTAITRRRDAAWKKVQELALRIELDDGVPLACESIVIQEFTHIAPSVIEITVIGVANELIETYWPESIDLYYRKPSP